MAAYVSSQAGFWDVAATWGGAGVPAIGDTATVNHLVVVRGDAGAGTDGGATVAAIVLGSSGKLKWGDPDNELGSGATVVNGDWTLTLEGTIDTNATGGVFQVGEESYPIPEDHTATIQFQGSTGFDNMFDPGTFRIHGYPSYHMASADMQRARLIVDVAAANDQSFQTDKDVDWTVGDTIWVGTGGDPEETLTDCEQVTIKTKTNASTYTADFTYAHYGDGTTGDLLIHATRNVRILGEAAKGFRINTNRAGDTAYIDVAWVYHEYASYGASRGVYSWYPYSYKRVTTDRAKVNNCIFDKGGSASGDGNQIMFYFNITVLEEDLSFENIAENHAWDFGTLAYIYNCKGQFKFGHLSGFNMKHYGIYPRGDVYLHLRGFWYIGDNNTPDTYNRGWYKVVGNLRDFKVYRAYKALDFTTGSDFMASPHINIVNGEIFHIAPVSSAPCSEIYLTMYGGNITFDNVDFYTNKYEALRVRSIGGGDLVFRNCKFDKCNWSNTVADGALQLAMSGVSRDRRLMGCEFGLREINGESNVWLDAGWDDKSGARYIFEDCKFKKCDSQRTSTYDWFNEVLGWAVWTSTDINTWAARSHIGQLSTLEFVNCEIQDAAGVDQWATEYPNTTRLGIVAGGGEIHKTHPTNESTGYIDGTFQRKLMPFTGTIRQDMTKAAPIHIPCTSGQVVTAKLSFKKNISQEEGNRPKLHLDGCGVIDEVEMADGIATWEELEVSGTADYDGVMELWVSCRGVPDIYVSGAGPVRGLSTEYTWAYPIDPGGTGLGPAGLDNLILYCDGLDITRV